MFFSQYFSYNWKEKCIIMAEELSVFHLKRLGSHDNSEPLILKYGSSTIGRVASNNIVCNSAYVSRKHGMITVTETDQVKLTIEKTINGIYINGQQKSQPNLEILLYLSDIFGIGCDTSIEEIEDPDCFVFQLKRKESEVILIESDEEDDCKIQEQYSQFNLSEIKKEMMELEDFVEEYSRVKCEEKDDVHNFEIITIDDKLDVFRNDGDVLETIISNFNKSYTEKNDLIKRLAPDPFPLLSKNSSIIKIKKSPPHATEESSFQLSHNCKEKSNDLKKSSTSTQSELEMNRDPITVDVNSPVMRQLQFSISLTSYPSDTFPDCVKQISAHNHKKLSLINNKEDNKSDEQFETKIIKRRHTCFVPSSNIVSMTKRKVEIIDAPHMPKRQKNMSVTKECPKAGTTNPTGNEKNKFGESHKLKRKRSNSASISSRNSHAKIIDHQWLSKNKKTQPEKHSKKVKEEIKSKLAALAENKIKMAEAKPLRQHTKIPVKNTRKTRSHFLTDTILNSATLNYKPTSNAEFTKTSGLLKSTSGTKNRIPIDKTSSPSTSEDDRNRLLITDTHIPTTSKNVQNTILTGQSSHSPSFLENAPGHKSDVNLDITMKNSVPPHKSARSSGNNVTENQTKEVDECNRITVVSTPTDVTSILKKSNLIRKRRATVTFADVTPIKKITVTESVNTIEQSSDDVIYNIMALGVSSLKKTRTLPINGNKCAYKPVAYQYESIDQLKNVFIPLMKAELWKEIEDGYVQSENKHAEHVQMNYCSEDQNYKNRFKCHCETKASAAIQIGALVIVTNVTSGKTFFAYVVNRQTTNQTCYFQFLSSFEIANSSIMNGLPLTIKSIMYIRPNLKVFDAIFKLQNSPLVQHILQPNYNCLELKSHPFEYMGYKNLNPDQMDTLRKVYLRYISAKPFISLIEGPPGTGKSRLVTNLIVQLLYGNEIQKPLKILVCAPSNAAVDIIAKSLMEARKNYIIKNNRKKMKIVRFGVLEKMDRSVRGLSIQEFIKKNEKTVLVEREKLIKLKKKKQCELGNLKSSKLRHTKEVKFKVNAIKKEISAIETMYKNVTYDENCILNNSNVICTTLNSCCTLLNKISSMDICIIDESTQCNEPTSLIPLQFGIKALVLVGDTKQLPSTVVSEIAKQYNYDQSLFQRLQKSLESAIENPISQLTIQYRMHPEILHWPNDYFYKNQLVSAESLKNNTLVVRPYTVFNLNFEQSSHNGPKHIANVDEANFVRHLLDFLIKKADPKVYSYGIISAYSKQKDDLAKKLGLTYPFVSVNTIDSCQGQERDIIIISIARSRGIGFLAIRQRLNVALTRAKKVLILCGNFNSLQSHLMWAKLLDDAKRRNVYIHLPNMDDKFLESFFEKQMVRLSDS